MMSGKVTPCSKVSQLQKRGGLLWNERKLKKTKIPKGERKVREEAKFPKVERRGSKEGAERVAGIHVIVLCSFGLPQHRAS